MSDAGITTIVDIRSFPGSRHNPQFGRDQISHWVVDAGMRYRWLSRLGGRRRPVAGSEHVALRNASFRAYADHMGSEEFRDGVTELLQDAARPTTVMCSESVWWRCHRRLVADHLVLVEGVEVVHLMHDGRQTAHVPTDGVRRVDGRLRYDGGGPQS